jgi:predicted lipase
MRRSDYKTLYEGYERYKENFDLFNVPDFSAFNKYVNVLLFTYGLVNEIDLKTGLDVDNSTYTKYSQNIKLPNQQLPTQNFLLNHKDIYPIINILRTKYYYKDITLLFGTPYVNGNLAPTSIFGFIAIDDSNSSGIISIRGTNDTKDWLANANMGTQRLNLINELKFLPNNIEGYKGFVNIYGINGQINMSKQIQDWVNLHPNINNYFVIGHSLGAALATIASYHLKKINKNVKAYLYSSPRICTFNMAKDYDSLLYDNTYNFYNSLDIVHQSPLSINADVISALQFGSSNIRCFNHIGKLLAINYVNPIWGLDSVKKSHLLGANYYPEELRNIWKKQIFTNPQPPQPTYAKFKYYSEILNILFNETDLLNLNYTIYSTVGADGSKSIPNGCINGENRAGLCYINPDPSKYEYSSPGIFKGKCPVGYDRWDGTGCWNDADTFGITAWGVWGETWANSLRRCKNGEGVNCEAVGAFAYPKCVDKARSWNRKDADKFYNTGWGTCQKDPRVVYPGLKSVIGTPLDKCPTSDREKLGGLCYPKCPDGYERLSSNIEMCTMKPIETYINDTKILNKFTKYMQNIVPLVFTYKNYSYCVGFIGKQNQTGIIVFGIKNETFPVSLNLTNIIETTLYDSNNNSSVIKVFYDFYYNSIKTIIYNWMKNNSVNNFTIIGQNAGSSFGIISALDLLKNNKTVNELYLYGSIKTGDLVFSNAYNNTSLGSKTFNFLNIQDQYVNLLSGLWSPHCGKIYNLDISPPGSECNNLISHFDYVRNPRSYLNVSEWSKILS